MRPLSCCLFLFSVVMFPPLLMAETKSSKPVTFEKDVRPIFKAHCLECHGEGEKLEGEFDLRLRRLIFKGGDSGEGFVAGKPDGSTLYERVVDQEMPPGDTKLTKHELATIKQWIATGAKTAKPEPKTIAKGTYFTEGEKKFWSFQPIKSPHVPKVKHQKDVRTPVDAFLLRK